MSYEYKASKAERKAAEVLRRNGWRISEPACPLCHGSGYVSTSQTIPSTDPDGGTFIVSQTNCPNGCLVGAWFFSSSTATLGVAEMD